jgi:hypothetical protein
MLRKYESNFDSLKAGGFNVQLWTCAGDSKLCLKAGDLASLVMFIEVFLLLSYFTFFGKFNSFFKFNYDLYFD